MDIYLHLQRAKHSFDKVKGVPSLKRGLVKGEALEKYKRQTPPAEGHPLLAKRGSFKRKI